jgi:hypothetical protein
MAWSVFALRDPRPASVTRAYFCDERSGKYRESTKIRDGKSLNAPVGAFPASLDAFAAAFGARRPKNVMSGKRRKIHDKLGRRERLHRPLRLFDRYMCPLSKEGTLGYPQAGCNRVQANDLRLAEHGMASHAVAVDPRDVVRFLARRLYQVLQEGLLVGGDIHAAQKEAWARKVKISSRSGVAHPD